MDFSDEDEAIQKLLGTSTFGKQDAAANIEAQIEQCRRKKNAKPVTKKLRQGSEDSGSQGKRDSDEDDEDDSDEDDDDPEEDFPISHDLMLKTHDKPINSISIDPSGARLVSGSNDCTFKLHDFASMTATTLRAFKSVDPSEDKQSEALEAHPVQHIEFNPLAPSQILVISAHPQAKLFSRDGERLAECVKGDMYLRDLNNTKGHISEVTSGGWSPVDKNLFVTGGTDSTLRIWDVNNHLRSQRDVIVFKSKMAGAAGRSRITALAWGVQEQGNHGMIVAAALDGTLVLHNGVGPYTRPVGEIRDAHAAGTWTTGIAVKPDGRLIVSRGGDDTVKLWDTRKFKTPVATAQIQSAASQYPTSNIIFSPSGANILLGSPTGDLHILNPALRPEIVTPIVSNAAITSVLWHPKLNQILCATSTGETHILFSPQTSTSAAVTILSKLPKRRHIDDDPTRTVDISEGYSGDIVAPGSSSVLPSSSVSFSTRHPTIGLSASGKSRDPRRPHMPAVTPFGKSAPSEQHIMQNVPLSSMRDEDPREALLKYAEVAERDPKFTKAYQLTQPKTIYADAQNEEEPAKKKARR
jgi:WD repeat-containing protein 70